MENRNIVTIDGPAGAGKGTLTERLCAHYGFAGLDTGSLYRAITLRLIEIGFDMDAVDPEAATRETQKISDSHEILRYAKDPGIRSMLTNKYVSGVSKIPSLRQVIKQYQVDFGRNPPPLADGRMAGGAVVEGRDIGTVIFPDAPVKLFVTASAETRAARRTKQFLEQGETASYPEVLKAILERDHQDMTRRESPLVPAADSVVIDTGENDKDATFALARKLIDGRLFA
ncbi:MAG: (d)CMP kinase [Rickettsiales bacterium]|jgi:cytidylate kinase|nr:(d)CMP kinase [Rickettsiales bacterium]